MLQEGFYHKIPRIELGMNGNIFCDKSRMMRGKALISQQVPPDLF